jgi:hypothetical protein
MKLTGRILMANIGLMTNKPGLMLEINERGEFEQMVDELRDVEKLSIEIKPYRARRSLDANAYFWVLCDKLSEKLRKSKTEIYRELIRDIGGVSETVCVVNSAVERFRANWQAKGLGWQTEAVESKIEGCTNVTVYFGSSTFDKDQMARLLDLTIQECREQGIATETPDEIARLKSLWGE